MAIFRYRMQNILNIKTKFEDQAKQNFATMQAKLNEEEEILNSIKNRRDLIAEEGRIMRQNKIDILKLKENEALVKYLEEQIKAQIMKVKQAEKNLETARIRLTKARQEREIQDKLKEKAFEEFMQEENMKEAKEIDQLTSYTYGKNLKNADNAKKHNDN